LLFCEGRITEPQYLAYIRNALRDSLLVIEVSKEAGDPLHLVEAAVNRRDAAVKEARRLRDDNVRFDEVWCVLDVDQHARLEAARALAEDKGIHLAVSNPCFELWPVLHFREQQAHLTTAAAIQALRAEIAGYDKHLDCAQLRGKYVAARNRAVALDLKHERESRPFGANPSTGVWRLVDALLGAATAAGAPVPPESL
jgi:hypothetical protein